MADNKKDELLLSDEHRERLLRVVPIALELMENNGPDDMFEKVKSMEPEDAYIVGMVIGKNLTVLSNDVFMVDNRKKN